MFKYKNENEINTPVSFKYIIANIQGQLDLTANSVVDITPVEAFELIQQTYENLEKIHFNFFCF